jgi:hypothetical protein
MPFLNDAALDALLNYVQDNVETLHICSTLPTTYTEATVTYDLGNKASPTMAEPSDRGGGGRESVVSAITDGSVTATGTADFWALVKDSATSTLLAAGDLSAPQAVTSGNTFTLTSFAVGVPDAV